MIKALGAITTTPPRLSAISPPTLTEIPAANIADSLSLTSQSAPAVQIQPQPVEVPQAQTQIRLAPPEKPPTVLLAEQQPSSRQLLAREALNSMQGLGPQSSKDELYSAYKQLKECWDRSREGISECLKTRATLPPGQRQAASRNLAQSRNLEAILWNSLTSSGAATQAAKNLRYQDSEDLRYRLQDGLNGISQGQKSLQELLPHLQEEPVAAASKSGGWLAQPEVGEKLDLEMLQARSVNPLLRRPQSGILESVASDSKAYLVYTKGPATGQIYQILEPDPRPLPELGAVKQQLEEIRQGLHSDSLPLQQAWEQLTEIYHGSESTAGLGTARLFAGGAQYDDLLQPIEKDFQAWAGFQGEFKPAFAQKAQDGQDGGPLRLVHQTTSDALPGILQLGALECTNQLFAVDLPNAAGEFGDGSGGLNPDKVSFWDSPKGVSQVLPQSFGPTRMFSTPITFAVNHEKAAELDIRQGTCMTESTTRNLPMESVSHVFVPQFEVERTRQLFAAHGHPDIQILPFESTLPA